jgi:predicted ATPase
MIEKITIRGFKSIEEVEFDPGRVNVFIGANGSGKSNLLEAVGVLSAAAGGRVDDEALLRRGVRPGVPALYKCAFPGLQEDAAIYLSAANSRTCYEVALGEPGEAGSPTWRYRSEKLTQDGMELLDRKPAANPEAGLAALKMVEWEKNTDQSLLLNNLRGFLLYSPETQMLRGFTPDVLLREPLGIHGGNLPKAINNLKLYKRVTQNKNRLPNSKYFINDTASKFIENVLKDASNLIDWLKSFGTALTDFILPSGDSMTTLQFRDRYMREGLNALSSFDASEGALYVLFHAVLAAHPQAPAICAVDNADHAMNPRLARALFKHLCGWYKDSPVPRQIFLTTHNPYTLDGLPLQDDSVRLFAVDRSSRGRTVVERIVLDDKLRHMAEKGWTLSRLWVMGHLGGVPNV